MSDYEYITNGIWAKAYDDMIHLRKVHKNGYYEYFKVEGFVLEEIIRLWKLNKINVLRKRNE